MSEDQNPVLARRTAFGVLGAGLAAAAGCSSYGSSGGTSTAPAPAAGTELGPAADVPVGGGKVYPDQRIVVTQPQAGTFAAFSAVCPHQGCTVDSVQDGTIGCPCHGSKFKIADGSVVQGPANRPLEKKNVKVTGGKLELA